MSNFRNRLLQLIIIPIAQLLNAVFPIKSLSYDFISLDELVDFSRQLIVLMANNSNVIVHWLNFDL